MTCPLEEEWDKLASGLTQDEEADRLVEHASWCGSCAEQLRFALEVFKPEAEVTPLKVTNPRPWFAFAAAAAFAICSLPAFWYWQKANTAQNSLVQLAQYYADNRMFDVRLPQAVYGPVRVTRSAILPALPPELLQLAAQIEKELAAHPNSFDWLAAKGRLALLSLDYRTAIDVLKLARDLSSISTPARSELGIDLASAYALRAKQTQNAADNTLAVELLSEILIKEPANTTARFNRAIIEERLSLLIPAIEDFEKAAASETDQGWKLEALQRAEQLRRKLGAAFQSPIGGAGPAMDEEALDNAMRKGLFSGSNSELLTLSERLELNHQDQWLKDVIRLGSGTASADSIQTLTRMAEIRLTNANARYNSLDKEFSILAKAHLSQPLSAWAEFETLYRATHVPELYKCSVQKASPKYSWLAAQTARESAICLFQHGDATAAFQAIEEATLLAARHNFPVSAIRGTGMKVSMQSRFWRYRESINLAQAALNTIFEERLPFGRMHQFLSASMLSQARLGRLHSARQTAAMAAGTAKAAGFQSVYYTNLAYWAELAHRTGLPAEAEAAYRAALDMDAKSGGQAVTAGWRAWGELNLADALNQPARLLPVEDVLANSKDTRQRTQYALLKSRFESEAGDKGAARRRLEALLQNELAPRNASVEPISRDQVKLARSRLAQLLLDENKPAEALGLLMERQRPPLGTVMFALTPLNGKLAGWRNRDGIVEMRWIDVGVLEYQQLARRLIALVSRPNSLQTEIEKTAQQFAKTVFSSWLSEIEPGHPVCFAIDPELIEIPFGVLPGKSSPLAVEFSVAMGCAEVTPIRPRHILSVDATKVRVAQDWRVAPLPPADAELNALRRMPGRVELLSGPSVSPTEVEEALGSADFFHFAGHAISQPDGAALLLTPDKKHPDGLLHLGISLRKMPAFAVLSACSTARASQEELDTIQPLSLARALLLQGSSQVIASYWDVESEASVAFMTLFYKSLAGDGDAGEGLRLASRDMRNNPRYRHPYYWAVYARIVKS